MQGMKVSNHKVVKFRDTIWRYYREHGRTLPWRNIKNPYKITVSEIMLQQTQVERIFSKYALFVRAFPNWKRLAGASPAQVLAAWQGLGYNRRALALKKIAEIVVRKYKGKLPSTPALLDELPGIGPATAGSISAFAFNIPVPFIETNIRRVFIYFFFPKKRAVKDSCIMPLVEKTIDTKNPREWFWALMDYGALLAAREKENPNRRSAHYRRQSRFAGSHRQLRGNIITLLLAEGNASKEEIARRLSEPPARIHAALLSLHKEQLIRIRNGKAGIVR